MGMTVDIDIGGTGLGNIDDEEVDSIEDMEEVEAVEIVEDVPEQIPPQKTPPSVAKKPNPWVKRIMVVSVVVILIVVGLFAFIYFGTSITNITVGLSEDNSNLPDKITVTALVGTTGSASVAGEGKLEISYEDDIVSTSKISIDDGGTGVVDVPYNSFIEGNGNYYFQVKYEGKESPPQLYEVDYIVERINITEGPGVVNYNGQLNVTYFMQRADGNNMNDLPKDADLTVDEIRNLDNNDKIADDEEPEEVDDSFIRLEFDYSKSGNYTFSASLINKRVKPDSDYYEITETRDKVYINLLPRASSTKNVNDPGVPFSPYSVDFDASASWNDGDISAYVWDFDDGSDPVSTDIPTISHTFTAGTNHDVVLNVQGDVWIWDGTEFAIERGPQIIHVNAP
jgi:hypothetical protein